MNGEMMIVLKNETQEEIMKKRYISAFLILLGILLVSIGCGGGSKKSGSPGSDIGDTGILISSVNLTPEDGAEFDTAIHCCSINPQTGACDEFEEGLFIDYGDLLITTEAYAFDAYPASIEQCRITYKKANEDPSSPLIESTTIFPNCIISTVGETLCLHVPIMDIRRKTLYWDDIGVGFNLPLEYPTHYIAVFNCEYMNSYGDRGDFQVETDVWLADWDLC
jgi:hypothetical protein